jgi:serine/threonine-protein kinase
MQPLRLTPGMRASAITGEALFLSLLAISCLLARRHLVAGRGDRAGAFRLATYVVASGMVTWLLFAHHVPDFNAEATLASRGLGAVLALALMIWILYLAIEPYVRRRWPHTLISWTRVLSGSFSDPRVGRDVLIGMAAGAAMAVYWTMMFRVPSLIGQPALPPLRPGLDALLGMREIAGEMIFGQVDAAAISMTVLLMLLLLRRVMPEWLAVAAVVVLATIPDSLNSDLPLVLTLSLSATSLILPTVVLLRFGLLAAITTLYVANQLAVNFPFGPALGGWMSGPAVVVLLVLGGLALFAFRAATAARRRG